MKNDITAQECSIKSILSATKGKILPGSYTCGPRHSDCFVFVLTGEAHYFFNGHDVLAEPGNIIYLAYRSKYEIHIDHCNYTFIYTDFFFQDSDRLLYENRIYKAPRLQSTDHLFMEMYRLWNLGAFPDKVYCKSLLYNIYSSLIASVLLPYMPGPRKLLLEKAVRYIFDHYDNPSLDSAQLADIAQVSEVHFRRLFKQLYHTSPVKFMNEVRINESKRLLTDRELSVQEISDRCGFSSSCYFARMFKKFVGVSPSEYRSTADFHIPL